MGKEPKSSHNVRHQPVATCSKKQVPKRESSTQKESFTCGYCHIDYLTFEKLHSHKCYPFQCPKCLQIFKHDVQLIHVHLEDVHSQNQFPSIKTLTCDFCDYTCRVPELLSKHKLTCHKKSQNCEKCKIKLCFNEEKYCKKCKALVFDHNDYSLRRNIQLNDTASVPSTSATRNWEDPSKIGEYTKYREQLSENMSPPSLRSNSTSVKTFPNKGGLKKRGLSEDKKIVADINAQIKKKIPDDSSNSNMQLTKINRAKETASLKRGPSIRKCVSIQPKEVDLKKVTSANLRHKKTNVESSKDKPLTKECFTNQSNDPSENVITKMRLKQKSDLCEVVTTKSKMSSNLSKMELLGKDIANINSISKSSTNSLIMKHPIVKNTDRNKHNSTEKNSAPIFSTMDLNMANIENIINSLPDSESGILLRCSNETNTSYKCVRCYKLLKLNAGCMHFSSCKARFKKMLISMNDLIFLCIHCCLAFNNMSELSKHKKDCSKVSTKPSASNIIDFLQHKTIYNFICKDCNFNCLSLQSYRSHSCSHEVLKLKRKWVVCLDQPRKLDLEPEQEVPYYQCKECERISIEMSGCRSHIKKCHRGTDENNFTSLSVIYTGRKISSVDNEQNISVTTKRIKQEKDRNGRVKNFTSSYNCSNTVSKKPMNSTTNPTLIAELCHPRMYECTCYGVPLMPTNERKPCLVCYRRNISKTVLKSWTTHNNQTKDPTSVGSSQQLFSSCSENNTSRIFPTPPATPEYNFFSLPPKGHAVLSCSHFTSCSPAVTDSDICGSPKSQELQNDSSAPCVSSTFDQNDSLRSALHSTSGIGTSADQDPNSQILDNFPHSPKSAAEEISHPPKSQPSLLCGTENSSNQPTNNFNNISQLYNIEMEQLSSLSGVEFDFPSIMNSIMETEGFSDMPNNLLDTIQEVKNGPFTLKYSWMFSGQTDLIAFVPSYQNCNVSEYKCSKCCVDLNTTSVNEICEHIQLKHNQTNGNINILYAISSENVG